MLRLSYSKIQTFLHCRQAYRWAYIEGLVPKQKPMPLQVGDVVHQLMHLHYKGQVTKSLLEHLDEWVQQLYPNNLDDQSLQVALQAGHLFLGYLEHYQDDPLQIISSEIVFELDIGCCILEGKVDALTRTKDQRLWRHEYKTTARLDSMYLQGLKGGLQGAIYDYAIEQLFHERLEGTVYDLLVKTTIPQYHRTFTLINRKAIERMLQTVEGVAQDIQKGNLYPSSQCFGFSQECVYKPLCEFDSPQTREAFYEKKGGSHEKMEGHS